MTANNHIKILISAISLCFILKTNAQPDSISMKITNYRDSLNFIYFPDYNFKKIWLRAKIYNPTNDTLKVYPVRDGDAGFIYFKKNSLGNFEIQPPECKQEMEIWLEKLKTTIMHGDTARAECAFASDYPSEKRYGYYPKKSTKLKDMEYKSYEFNVTPKQIYRYWFYLEFYGYKIPGKYKQTIILKLKPNGYLSTDFYFNIKSNKHDSLILSKHLEADERVLLELEPLQSFIYCENNIRKNYNLLQDKNNNIAHYLLYKQYKYEIKEYFEYKGISMQTKYFLEPPKGKISEMIKFITKDEETIKFFKDRLQYSPYLYHEEIFDILTGYAHYNDEHVYNLETTAKILNRIYNIYAKDTKYLLDYMKFKIEESTSLIKGKNKREDLFSIEQAESIFKDK